MTTRSGRRYRLDRAEMYQDEDTTHEETTHGEVSMARMLEVLLEDRQKREAELLQERRLREEELKRREEEMREKRRKRDEAAAKREEEMRMQMELLRGLVEGVNKQGDATMKKLETDRDVKVTKLTEADDIEAYLTTFERLMKAYEVPPE